MFLKLSTNFGQKPSFSLDVFDVPVKNYLINEVRQLGHDPDEIDPVLDKAIERAKELLLQRFSAYSQSKFPIADNVIFEIVEFIKLLLNKSEFSRSTLTILLLFNNPLVTLLFVMLLLLPVV